MRRPSRPVSVEGDGCWRAMRVRGIDQDVVEGNAELALDPPGRHVKNVAVEHEHVASDQSDLAPLRILDDNRRGAKLPFLAHRLARTNSSADHQRVVGDKIHRPGLATPPLAGGNRWPENADRQ